MSELSDDDQKILRDAVDKVQKEASQEIVNSKEVKDIIKIVEEFISKKGLICYGGTAINNILPKHDQFYDKSLEIPDYDFFSHNALDHAKELADIYKSNGYTDVEAKAGVHFGTYKVFVNFIPVADITQLVPEIFKNLKKESIVVDNISYASPNFLRMSMYLELSRPKGDVGRWEKVLKRLILLNKHYPIKEYDCKNTIVGRGFYKKTKKVKERNIYNVVKKICIQAGVVFFGSYAFNLYSRYMPNYLKNLKSKAADFDIIAINPLKAVQYIKYELKSLNILNVNYVKHAEVGEIIPVHYELKIGKETIAFIYEAKACYSYNEIYSKKDKTNIKVATIDTILSFYLSFLFSNRDYYDKKRLVCLAQFLFVLQQKNRLKQVGLLKRFSTSCYGEQETLESIRSHKTDMYNKLSKNKDKKEYDEWFLKYTPNSEKKTRKNR